jgi:hypothetical protein
MTIIGETPALSRKRQWLKIAGEAIHGAAAGAAHTAQE